MTLNRKANSNDIMKNNKSNYLSKTGISEMPLVFPIMDVHDKVYKNNSQKNRFEKNYQIMLNIKCRIENEFKNAKFYAKEVKFI